MPKEYIERKAAVDTIVELADLAVTKAAYAAIRKSARALDDVPAADVAEIVRCGQCYFYDPKKDGTGLCTSCAGMQGIRKKGDFCSSAIRGHGQGGKRR